MIDIQAATDAFIEESREDSGSLAWTTEITMRVAFARGLQQGHRVGYAEGSKDRSEAMISAIGIGSEESYA